MAQWKMFALLRHTAILLLLLGITTSVAAEYGLGTTIKSEHIQAWDIDIRPDGAGLPAGSGDAESGETIYAEQCAHCHGEFGEAVGRYPALIGGEDSLDGAEPVKSVGSYWPYATTLFDYIRRAMPFGNAQTLSNDEVYALTAFILASNDIVDYEFVASKETLAQVEMPNRDGFIDDPRPDAPPGEPCMQACAGDVEIIGRAERVDVTPEIDTPALTGAAAAPPASFNVCRACHSLRPGAHGIGPSLAGVLGRVAGKATGFNNYSAAMRKKASAWTSESLSLFLENPQAVVPGTSMAFAGIKDAAERQALVEFLNSIKAD